MDDCLVCIPESHPYRVTSTKCRIDTVVSPDDGHIFARNMHRKEINILRKSVHQVGFIYKVMLGCTVNKTKFDVHGVFYIAGQRNEERAPLSVANAAMMSSALRRVVRQ